MHKGNSLKIILLKQIPTKDLPNNIILSAVLSDEIEFANARKHFDDDTILSGQ